MHGQGVVLLPTRLVHSAIAVGALVTLLSDWDGGIVPDLDQAVGGGRIPAQERLADSKPIRRDAVMIVRTSDA